jgi:opacity protein-like surface antigen
VALLDEEDDAMGSLKVLAFAGAAAMMSIPAAQAADLPPIIQRAMPAAYDDFASGWYLRGDVGIGVQGFNSFDHFQTNAAFVWPASWQILNKEHKDPTFVAIGLGYQFNNWLRFDATAEYRTRVPFFANGSYSGVADFCAGGGTCFDVYNGNHGASVFMANAYIDLGTWWRVTPFIGAGVGAAYHTINAFWDLGINSDGTTGRGFATDHTSWELAWAVHAGMAFDITHNLKLEAAYRYLNMGDVRTGIVDCAGCGVVGGPLAYYKMRNLDSHDFKLGFRYLFTEPVMPPPPPLVRKG